MFWLSVKVISSNQQSIITIQKCRIRALAATTNPATGALDSGTVTMDLAMEF